MNKSSTAVIFDMDGLLFNNDALYQDAIIAAATELGNPVVHSTSQARRLHSQFGQPQPATDVK